MSRGIHTLPVRGMSDDWVTPRYVVDALGVFDLDPCACEPMPWHLASRWFTKSDNGLTQPWRGRVWLNPPYGPEAERFLMRLADHGNGIALIPARTETRWFHEQVWQRADAVMFLRGRLTFLRPDGSHGSGNSGHSSCLVAYGLANVDALRASGLPGVVVNL